jgi:hypothetical protein
MGDNWPLCEKLAMDEAADTNVDPAVESGASHGEGRPADWTSSDSMVWLSDHDRSPSSRATGGGQSIARQ